MRQIKATWLFPSFVIAAEVLTGSEKDFMLLLGNNGNGNNTSIISGWPQVSKLLCKKTESKASEKEEELIRYRGEFVIVL